VGHQAAWQLPPAIHCGHKAPGHVLPPAKEGPVEMQRNPDFPKHAMAGLSGLSRIRRKINSAVV
jgi:hypothetical protein